LVPFRPRGPPPGTSVCLCPLFFSLCFRCQGGSILAKEVPIFLALPGSFFHFERVVPNGFRRELPQFFCLPYSCHPFFFFFAPQLFFLFPVKKAYSPVPPVPPDSFPSDPIDVRHPIHRRPSTKGMIFSSVGRFSTPRPFPRASCRFSPLPHLPAPFCFPNFGKGSHFP